MINLDKITTDQISSIKPVHTFQVGRTYWTRDGFNFLEILARTPQSVIVNVHGKQVRRAVSIYNGVEQFRPFGSCSAIAPVISADRCRAPS